MVKLINRIKNVHCYPPEGAFYIFANIKKTGSTVLGLVVAIPTTLLHSFANSSARGIINVLEEQSTGIVAEHSDSK